MAAKLGSVGIWSLELRFGDRGETAEAAAELDELGYGALWVPGGIDDKLLPDLDHLLGATGRMPIASGILNIWKIAPPEVGAWWEGLSERHRDRLLLGLGVSHGPIIGETYQQAKPLTVMREYLDGLSAAGVPGDAVCLAALGPKMLEMAGERTAGAHPYLVTPEHSARARAIVGPDKLVAPEQGVILETDPAKARELGRKALDHYRFLPNYRNNWLRLGIAQDDIDDLSDGLIDALFAWGSPEQIKARVDEHLAAGASHVCMQLIGSGEGGMAEARRGWRELAAVML